MRRFLFFVCARHSDLCPQFSARYYIAFRNHICLLTIQFTIVMIRYLFIVLLATLTACVPRYASQPEPGAPRLFKTWWRVEKIEGRKAEFLRGQRRDMHVILYSSRTMVGSGGCNRINGLFTQLPGVLRFRRVASTKMMCRPEVMARDRVFVAALGKSRTYRIEGRWLKLFDQRGREVLRFMAVNPR